MALRLLAARPAAATTLPASAPALGAPVPAALVVRRRLGRTLRAGVAVVAHRHGTTLGGHVHGGRAIRRLVDVAVRVRLVEARISPAAAIGAGAPATAMGAAAFVHAARVVEGRIEAMRRPR